MSRYTSHLCFVIIIHGEPFVVNYELNQSTKRYPNKGKWAAYEHAFASCLPNIFAFETKDENKREAAHALKQSSTTKQQRCQRRTTGIWRFSHLLQNLHTIALRYPAWGSLAQTLRRLSKATRGLGQSKHSTEDKIGICSLFHLLCLWYLLIFGLEISQSIYGGVLNYRQKKWHLSSAALLLPSRQEFVWNDNILLKDMSSSQHCERRKEPNNLLPWPHRRSSRLDPVHSLLQAHLVYVFLHAHSLWLIVFEWHAGERGLKLLDERLKHSSSFLTYLRLSRYFTDAEYSHGADNDHVYSENQNQFPFLVNLPISARDIRLTRPPHCVLSKTHLRLKIESTETS